MMDNGCSRRKLALLRSNRRYIGVGKTVRYGMAREGTIPARKVGKKRTLERTGLDAWVRGHRPVQSFFTDIEFKIEGNDDLRDAQREG